MPGLTRNVASLSSALVLSCITIGVFAVQTNQGPEGAIKRLHLGISTRNATLALNSTSEPQSPISVNLLNTVADLIQRRGAKVQQIAVYPTTRTRDHALVGVQYSLPENREITVIYVTVKSNRLWRVDSRATIAYMMQLTNPSSGLN